MSEAIKPTTDDIGIAIKDAVSLLDAIDLTFGEPGDTCDHMVEFMPGANGEDDMSNLRIIAGGVSFRVSIIMEG